jgi:ABC-type dipeptide/oligopeptide/nickel transport system permease component
MKSIAGSHLLLTALLTVFGFVIPVHAASVAVTYSFTGTGTVVDSTATTLTLQANASGSFSSGALSGAGFVGVTDFLVSGTDRSNWPPNRHRRQSFLCGFTLAIVSRRALGLGRRGNGQLV